MHQADKILIPEFRIFVINLEKAKDRRLHMISQMKSAGIHGYEFVKAVEGKDIFPLDVRFAKAEAERYAKPENDFFLGNYLRKRLYPGGIGCLKSHVKIYQMMVDENIEVALIFEDDAIINIKWQDILNFYHQLPPDWDLGYLGWGDSKADQTKKQPNSNIIALEAPFQAHAYFIKRTAAKKVIDFINPIRYINDDYLGRMTYWGMLKSYGMTPPLEQGSLTNLFPTSVRTPSFIDHIIESTEPILWRINNKFKLFFLLMRPITIASIDSGLGNQLFQYASARRLAFYNKNKLKFDTTSYKYSKNSIFLLDMFKIPAYPIGKNGSVFGFDSEKISLIVKGLAKYFPVWIKYFEERQHTFDKTILTKKGSFYLNGHFQSEKYFKDIEDIIKDEVVLREPLCKKAKKIEEQILKCSSISVHVRKFNYSSPENEKCNICSTDYYEGAFKRIKLTEKNPVFFIFSNDIEWCKKNIKAPEDKIIFVSGNGIPDYQELVLTSKCKHNIIANSAFSWWGAWLNTSPDKIVISPKEWFKGRSFDVKDLLPSVWIKL